MRRTLRVTALSAVLGSALVLAACGGDDDAPEQPDSAFGQQTVAEILSAARSDMAGVRSLSLEGETSDMEFEIELADDGTCAGSVDQYGGTAEFVETADGSYVKADTAYWLGTVADQGAQGEAKIATLEEKAGDRWIRTPREAGYFLQWCEFDSFVDLVTTGDPTKIQKGQEREIDGAEAVELFSDEAGITTRLWISTEAPHRVLQVTEDAGSAATFSLSDFDEPLDIQTPDPAEVFDLAAQNKKAE